MEIKIHCAYNRLVPIDEIKINPKNRNVHSNEQIEMLAKIIKANGVRRVLTISNLSGLLTVGHGRLAAMRKLGMTHVPVNYQDYENSDLEYADMVADNAIADWAHMDLAGINFDLADLGPDFDLELLGIKNFQLDVSHQVIDQINKGDETSAWVGMPEFETADKEIKLTMIFLTELQRDMFVEKNEIQVTDKRNNAWTSRL